ncbi:Disease resistance protein RML1B [Cardamine amara subsp. amara]|uniref:Disease resistance protein RML1B n=1 Tax=Cardamine amara subsp. amara TaxID=228776 RepID=A0ABD1C770_CARAN
MSLMASSSSFPSGNYNFNVFASFHGPDVRKTLFSHMRKQFKCNGITMFDDQKIERSATIAPALTEAIRESRILIVILSKKYASSSWCLDELLEILECKRTMGKKVMTIFYGVDPSHVRKQIGEFGFAFNETCVRKTNKERQKWRQALNEVGNIAGEDFLRWDNEATMITKIARDISDKLNATPSRDFDGMVGIEAHLREMESLLDLNYDGVKMVAITGPAGIGKTTIARALQSQVSNRFQLTCFMDNLRESYPVGINEYGLKLRLQEQFLSNVLNQDGIRICHSRVIEERLCKQKVLIILDDVNNIQQLMVLANETTWFGPGSRIVVTTENKDLLEQHGINNIYHVGFPSDEEAVNILCRYAFRKYSLYHGFENRVQRVIELCGKLPLGLSVVGSSLRGKKEDEWEDVINPLGRILYQDIYDVLRVGFKSLNDNEKTLFLNIAVFFFNYEDGDLVKTMFADSKLDVEKGLKILESRSLIERSTNGKRIRMHRLLQEMGKNTIHKQEPWQRQILLDAREICYVLEHAKGSTNVVGISFDISGINEVSISKKAFKRMPDLRFLRVYKSKYDGNDRMHIPEEIEFPRGLRLLNWEAYPSKRFPPTFNPEYLVELCMPNSKVEKLWEGTQPLANLKKMNLFACKNLKELPDLSNATNLEDMNLNLCESLVEIPSSCSHLHKLQQLWVNGCINLQLFPAHMNLASLETVIMTECSRMRDIPVMSTNIRQLIISHTAVESVPPSIRFCSRLEFLSISGRGKLKGLTNLPLSLTHLDVSNSNIEWIPNCIKALPLLFKLSLVGCRRLTSLPDLPRSLISLNAWDCESLETVFSPFNTPDAQLNFTNCYKLDQQARRAIIQRSQGSGILPGSKMPAEFDHPGKGNSLTIRPECNSYTGFVVCVVIHRSQKPTYGISSLLCPRKGQGDLDAVRISLDAPVFNFQTEHLLIFHSRWLFIKPSEMGREITFEFCSEYQEFDVIECSAKILTDESIERSYESGLYQVFEEDIEYGDCAECLSWLFFCFDLSKIVENVQSFVSGRRQNPEADDVSIS